MSSRIAPVVIAVVLVGGAGCQAILDIDPNVEIIDGGVSDGPEGGAAYSPGTPIVSGFGGKCLDDNDDATSNGNTIQLYTCNGTGAQNWTYTNGTFVGPGGKCLGIKANFQVSGTFVDLYTCDDGDGQQWTVSGTTIKSTKGLCLDVNGGVNADLTPIDVATCNGSESQIWHVDVDGSDSA